MAFAASETKDRTRLAWVLVAAGTGLLVWRSLLGERQTVDDLFIFLRYARNLAERGEYTFNPGERVEGTSSVVWTLALAAAWRLGVRGAGAAKAMSLAAAALVPATCAVAVRRLFPQRPIAMAVPALALALDADFATWAASGMDTALWSLACVGCVCLAAAKRLPQAAFAMGALSWVRPEGVLFALLGIFALGPDRRRSVHFAVCAAVPIALLTLLRLAYFHDAVPNTFWAKINPGDGRDYTGLGYLASALERRPCLLLLAPLGCAFRRRERVPLGVPVALLASSMLFALLAGGDWMCGRRLLVVALPLAGVLAGAAVASVRARGLSFGLCAVLAAEGALTFDHAVDQRWRDVEWLDERLARWRPASHPFVDAYPLDWMPTHLLREIAPYLRPGDTVAHVDVGELPYVLGDVAFLDGFGLVDRPAGRLAFSPRDLGLQASARDAFFARGPVAAIVVLGDDGRPLSPAQAAATGDARFAAGWRELDRVPTWGGHPCVTFVRRDVQVSLQPAAQARVQSWLGSVPDLAAAF